MSKILGYFFATLLFISCERGNKCQYAMNIAVGDLEKGAKLTLWIDEMHKKEFIAPYYFWLSKTQGILSDNYCNDNNVVNLKVSINEIDTVFSVNSKNIYKVYLGHDPQKNYKTFLVQFVYRESYKGQRPSEILFDD